jgi:cysteine desulfurase
MAANNEIGTVQPLAEIGALAHAAGALFVVDAAQAAGKIPIDVAAMQIDLLSLTGHKLYGPKGCGALFVRKRVAVDPMVVGGGQERGLRSGTLNVPGIVGLGAACAVAQADMAAETPRMLALRERLLSGLMTAVGGVTVNGSMTSRLPHNLHVNIDGVDGETLLVALDDVAISSGSACASSSGVPSHVLRAIFGANPVPRAAIRFGQGRSTTADEIDYTIERVAAVVRSLRRKSSN